MHPMRAHPAAQPTPVASRWNRRVRQGIAPLITMLSNPKSRPPNPDTVAAMTRYFRETIEDIGPFRGSLLLLPIPGATRGEPRSLSEDRNSTLALRLY